MTFTLISLTANQQSIPPLLLALTSSLYDTQTKVSKGMSKMPQLQQSECAGEIPLTNLHLFFYPP